MDFTIRRLAPEDYEKCGNIWDMKGNPGLAETFYEQLTAGNRVTWVCVRDGEFIAEASLVFDMKDADYTLPGQRAYFSRFLVKKDCRGQGIGTALARYVFDRCRELGFSELSVGVDLENFRALSLYHRLGFETLLFVGEDGDGKYLKLLKKL